MKKRSKRFQTLQNLILKKEYPISEGLTLLKNFIPINFNESFEIHFSFFYTLKKKILQIRDNIILPYGTGKSLKLLVLTESSNFNDLDKLNIDFLGSDELIPDILENKFFFDILITNSSFMPKLTKLGKFLGPKGLMPSIKGGTISDDLKQTVIDFKKGKFEYKTDKNGNLHLIFGKKNYSLLELQENLLTIFNSIQKNKPLNVKEKYIKSIKICTTMSPSISISLLDFYKYI